MMKRTQFYDPHPELPWLLPVPADRPDRELPPDRRQLDLLDAIGQQPE